MSSLQQVADFAISKIGCGYVFGATGWICSPARRKQQAAQYPQYESTIMGTCAKWDGVQCYDCAQLTKAACKAAGVTLPSGATSQWNKTAAWSAQGTIDTMPDEPGVILFRRSDGKMQHTEVYIGNRCTVGARSSRDGVKAFPVSEYAWTHWAKPAIPKDEPAVPDQQPAPAPIPAQPETQAGKRYRVIVPPTSAVNTVRMRSHPNKSAGFVKWLRAGDIVTALSYDPEQEKGWLHIQAPKHQGGVMGYMQTQFLEEVES